MFEDAGAGHDESSYARLHGLYWLCANLAAEQPLLVCVDDAQWADEPSLGFLGFLARRLEDLPVALVLGTRPRAEQESDVLRGLVTDPAHARAAPAGADRRRGRQWVRAAVDPSAEAGFCAACHETTGGNPFLVRELLHEVLDKQLRATDAEAAAVRELGPEAISTVVLQRLKRLPAVGPAMARAVAMLGEGARRRSPRELAELDAADRRGGARGALPRRRARPATATGSASCTRSCCRRSTATCRSRVRSEGHARAARLLHAPGAPEEIAAHQLARPRRAAKPGRSRRCAAAAARALVARRSRRRGGPPASARSPSRRTTPRARAPRRARPGRGAGRAAARRRALPRGDAAGQRRPAERGRVAIGLARCLKFARGLAGGDRVAARRARRPRRRRSELASELEIELVGSAYISLAARPLLRRRDRRASRARDAARPALDRLHLMASAFEAVIAAGPRARSAELAGARSPAAELPTDVSAGGHIYITAAIALMFSERYDEAERALRPRRRRRAPARVERRLRGGASSLRSLLHYRRGALAAAEADALAALDLRDDVQGSQGYLACALNALVFAALERGTGGAGAARARRRLLRHPALRGPALQPGDARARLAARVLGDLEGGLAELLACGERELNGASARRRSSPGARRRPRSACALGRLEQARALAARGARAGARDRRAARARGGAAGRGAGGIRRAAARAAARGGRRARGLAGGAGAGARARSTSAPRWSAPGRREGPRAAARRAGGRGGLRRDAAGRARPPRAAGHRRAAAADRGRAGATG